MAEESMVNLSTAARAELSRVLDAGARGSTGRTRQREALARLGLVQRRCVAGDTNYIITVAGAMECLRAEMDRSTPFDVPPVTRRQLRVGA